MKQRTLLSISKANAFLAVLAIPGTAVIFSIFEYVKLKVLHFEQIGNGADSLGLAYGGIIIAILGIHLFSIATVILINKLLKKVTFTSGIIFFLLVISSIFILADVRLLQDIGHEYEAGMDTRGEWLFLYITHTLHGLTMVCTALLFVFKMKQLKTTENPEIQIKEEIIFVSAQHIGILCGAFGIAAIVVSLLIPVPLDMLRQIVIPFGIIGILPYGLIAGIWLYQIRKEKLGNWYDEKQFLDVSKSGLAAFVSCILCMFLLYASSLVSVQLSQYITVLWFPATLFVSLLIFSTNLLILSKR